VQEVSLGRQTKGNQRSVREEAACAREPQPRSERNGGMQTKTRAVTANRVSDPREKKELTVRKNRVLNGGAKEVM